MRTFKQYAKDESFDGLTESFFAHFGLDRRHNLGVRGAMPGAQERKSSGEF